MARPLKKFLCRPRLPAVFNLRRLAWAFVGVAASLVAVFMAHHFAGPATRAKIEMGTLAVIDLVREARATPPEVVFWLDCVSDVMPMVRGVSVPFSTEELGDAASSIEPGGAPASPTPLTLLKNTGYSVGYDESRKTPAWAVYRVTKPSHAAAPRPAGFETDRRTRAHVASSSYVHSGYDRGHMAPNHAIAVCYGEKAQHETFLMSNITPQLHGLNDGLWREMEHRVLARYPRRFREAWITCGPVYDHPDHPKTIRSGVWVPDAFFLVVSERDADSGELRAQAYLVPHRDIPDTEDISRYLTDIRSIERRTGLDFFPALPREHQNTIETVTALQAW